MKTQAELIAEILKAPPDRYGEILSAARGCAKPKPGTIRQAAEILQCNPRTVDRYAEQGLLRKIRISPRRIRYDLNEVERLAMNGATI